MPYSHLPPFDPSRKFVVRQTKRIAGRAYRKGDPLDKSRIDDRLLRMLYDHHQIGYEGEKTRRDIDSAHPRRRGRDGGVGVDPARVKRWVAEGMAALPPVSNPDRARVGPEAGAGADAGVQTEPPAQLAGDAQQPAPAEAPEPEKIDPVAERIRALVRDNDRDALIAKAEKLDGFVRSMSKTQLAQLIAGSSDGAA